MEAAGAAAAPGLPGRFLDFERLTALKDDFRNEYARHLQSKSSEELEASHHEEPPVVGYIWSCPALADCFDWLLRRRRNSKALGVARAQEIRAERVNERGRQLLRRWSTDSFAVEITIATLSGESWVVRVGSDATVGELKAHLAAVTSIPVPEIALVFGGEASRPSDHERLPAAALRGQPPHATMLRVRRRRALSGSYDGTLVLWDVADNKRLATMRGHGDAVVSMVVDWTSRRALTGSHDNRLKLWDLDHCICVGTFLSPDHPAFCLAADWGAGRALSASWDRHNGHPVRVWDLNTGEHTALLRGHADAPMCLALDWGLQRALSGGKDSTLRLWDLSTSAEVFALPTEQAVSALAVDWAARRALTGHARGALRLWRLDGEEPGCLVSLRGHAEMVSDLSLDWPAGRAASASHDGALRRWDLPELRCVSILRPGANSALSCLAIDWAAPCALSGSKQDLVLLDLDSAPAADAPAAAAAAASFRAVRRLGSHEDTVSCVAIEPCDGGGGGGGGSGRAP